MVSIVALSDSHQHSISDILEGYKGDLLIVAGDVSMTGRANEMERFRRGLKEVRKNFDKVCFIFGNHELICSRDFPHLGYEIAEETDSIYLEDECVELFGYKTFGSPYVPGLPRWAYHYPRGTDRWKVIPDDVDILITHGPPHKILDEFPNCFGCYDLGRRIVGLPKLKLHIFGHTHGDGHKVLSFKGKHGNDFKCYNVCICDESYANAFPPTEIELPQFR